MIYRRNYCIKFQYGNAVCLHAGQAHTNKPRASHQKSYQPIIQICCFLHRLQQAEIRRTLFLSVHTHARAQQKHISANRTTFITSTHTHLPDTVGSRAGPDNIIALDRSEKDANCLAHSRLDERKLARALATPTTCPTTYKR